MSRLNPDFSRWNAILSNVAMLSINWCLGNMKVPVDNQQNQLRFWKAWQFIGPCAKSGVGHGWLLLAQSRRSAGTPSRACKNHVAVTI